VASEQADPEHESAGAWAKKYHLASRAVMESTLRPFDLGPTQWYILYALATSGPTPQRNLVQLLQVETATLTGVVAALVRKGLIEQNPDPTDRRQKTLTITADGLTLWEKLPDPIDLILKTAFDGIPDADVETVTRVLRLATTRLTNLSTQRNIT
jgi:MarR family transcriptional regulator, lower aerobic nicotinate degradation pathway regulator